MGISKPRSRFRHLKKTLSIGIIILALDILLSLAYVGFANNGYKSNPQEQAESVIVLFHDFNGGTGISDETIRRCRYARHLFLENRLKQIVCSGGLRQEAKKVGAALMAQWLSRHGISRHSILIEANSCDTMANIRNSQKLLRQKGYRSAFVVSSATHIRRLSYLISQETVSRDVALFMAPYPRRPARPKSIWLNDVYQANYEWIAYGLHFLLPRSIYYRIIHATRDCTA